MVSLLKNLIYPPNNIIDVAGKYAALLDIPITKSSLQKAIEGHPDSSSMLALSDAFSGCGAETLAVRITPEQLDGVDMPFIAQIKLSKSQDELFTIVKPTQDKSLIFLHPVSEKWESLAELEFGEIFTGIALFVEKGDRAGEADFDRKVKAEKKHSLKKMVALVFFPFLVITAILSIVFQQGIYGLLPASYLSFSFVGILVTSLLLWYDIDQHHPFLNKVCGKGGSQSDCGNILQSEGATVFGVGWGLIGFAYFSASLIILIVTGFGNSSLLKLLSWLSVMAFPYVLFSIYYQWRVAKQWCRLCLYVQTVLMAQASISMLSGWLFIDVSISFSGILAFVVLFACLAVGAQEFVSALAKAKLGEQHGKELQRLKNNPRVFQSLLRDQKAIEIDPTGLGITLGNPQAEHKIIKVCNPYCGPCAASHSIVEDILKDNPNVQVRIIFTAEDNDEDVKAAPVKLFLAIAEQSDEERLKCALDDWYRAEKKDYNTFSRKYQWNGELVRQGNRLTEMKDWCDKTAISFTPTFFVNGYQLPEMYTIKDLKHLLIE